MVDQEGGRVARLRPPHWQAHPPAAALGRSFEADPAAGLRAAWLTGALIGCDCGAAGFTVVAAPVLDIGAPGAHDVIGDRAFAGIPRLWRGWALLWRTGCSRRVSAGGKARAGTRPRGGGQSCRVAESDRADLSADIRPFALNADLPWMMTAHIVYEAIDPHVAATLSATVIETVIRGRIGFEGVLVTDDLAMKALSGAPADLAVQALAAGCDIALYCSGDSALTRDLLQACPALTQPPRQRLRAGRRAAAGRRLKLDPVRLTAERDRLLG